MTEDKWLVCEDPRSMVNYLRRNRRLRSDRKLRLFVCASCRLYWHMLNDARSREAVEVAERFADGLATNQQRDAAADSARAVKSRPYSRAEWLATCAAAAYPGYGAYYGAHIYQNAVECAFLRDIFGNPFHRVSADSLWLHWNDATVPKIAQRIYDEREYSLMPILADALEEADCDNDDILHHCREPGEHVRGCWVIDLLLGKS